MRERCARLGGGVVLCLDLEMTGVDRGTMLLVDFATLVTDDDLNVVAEGPDLVVHASEEDLAKMDDVVVEMHTRSGLLDEIRKSMGENAG